jgi:outer membrane lipoprotein SlyB
MKNKLSVFLVLITTGLVGCASNLSGDTYSRSDVRSVQQVQYGEIVTLRPVQIEGTKTPIGAGAGAVAGGIAGSTVGGGKGSAIMAVIGAVAGGVAGAAVEEGVTRSQGVEITVRLDSGKTVAIVQALSPNEKFVVGDQVRVMTNGSTSRVAQ